MKSIALLTLFTTANAQCGPNKDKPYPSNSETCPTYTKNTADGMAAETNTAPGRGGGSSCTALPCAASLLGVGGPKILSLARRRRWLGPPGFGLFR